MGTLQGLGASKRGCYRNVVLWVLFTAYLLITGLLASLHEPWRDEGQAWLIARDLSYGQILQQTGVEGHFFLWFYILKPFTGLPFMPTLSIVSYFFTAFGSYLVLFKLRFPLWFRCLLLVSPMLIYEYPVISRNYSLAYMLVASLLAFHGKRDTYPIIYSFILGLAMNVMVVSTTLCLALWFFYWYDTLRLRKGLPGSRQKKMNIAFVIGIFFLTLAIYQIILMFLQRSSMGSLLQLSPTQVLWGSLIIAALGLFVYAAACFLDFSSFLPAYAYHPWHTPLVVCVSLISYIIMDKLFNLPVMVLFGTTLFFAFMKNKYALKLSLICAVLAVISRSYPVSIRHTFILYLYLAALVALFSELSVNNQKKVNYWLIISILFTALSNLDIYISMLKDVNNDFSGALKAARYIKQQGFDNKNDYFLTTKDNPWVGAIAPLFPEKIFYFEQDEAYGSFTDWKKFYSSSTPQQDLDKLAAGRKIILISGSGGPVKDYELFASFPGLHESIYFYQKTAAP